MLRSCMLIMLLQATFAAATISWTVSNGLLLKNGQHVVMKGFSITCMEYLLNGIGVTCLPKYNFTNRSAIITTLDKSEMNAMYNILLPAPPGVQPTLRLQLNAGYFLDVPTPLWTDNRDLNPNLSAQYRILVDEVVQDVTSKGIALIIDLHWSDDVSQFSEMPLRGTTTSGDAVQFWTAIATKYAPNPLVFYDLFNAPHIQSYTTFMEGDTVFAGMRQMTTAILARNIKGMIIVGGQLGFAYDALSLVQFARDIASVDKIMFSFQPFLGPIVGFDQAKTADGFAQRIEQVSSATRRPIIATSLGQFCCDAEGVCTAHNGFHLEFPMGYVRAVLFESTKNNVSWIGFGWRPGNGGNCSQPDVNDGRDLFSAAAHGGTGADWSNLFPIFYPGNLSAAFLPTVSPTLATDSPTTLANTASSNLAVPVGAGVGGGLIALLGALGFFLVRKHHNRHRESDDRATAELPKWSELENRALQEKYQVTHDFEELCSVVPHRTAESVALKVKSYQQKSKSVFIRNFQATSSYVPSERFAFISPRKPPKIPRGSPSFYPPARESTINSSSNAPSPFSSIAGHHPSLYQQNRDTINPMYNSMRTTVSY